MKKLEIPEMDFRLNKIHHTDCLEFMKQVPNNYFDLIVTDPPYKVITGGRNAGKGQPSGILAKNKQLMRKIPELSDWLPDVYRILKDNSHVYIMVNLLNLKEMMEEVEKVGFYIHNLLVWEKANVTPNRWYMKNCEYVIFAKKGRAKQINNCGSKTVHKFKTNKTTSHPTEKPVELIKFYIGNSISDDGLVFDPFMGSGTTAIACKNMGIEWCGCELEDDYIEIANKRLEQVYYFKKGETK